MALIAAYAFDEGTGTTAAEANGGTTLTGVPGWAAGLHDDALRLNLVNGPSVDPFGSSGAFTIMFDAYIDGSGNGGYNLFLDGVIGEIGIVQQGEGLDAELDPAVFRRRSPLVGTTRCQPCSRISSVSRDASAGSRRTASTWGPGADAVMGPASRGADVQLVELIRVQQQGARAVADEVDGRLEAGEEEDERHRGGLVLREVLAVVGGADQTRDEVLAGGGVLGEGLPLAVDEVGEIAAHLLDRARDTAPRAA